MIESNDYWHIITQPTDDYLVDRHCHSLSKKDYKNQRISSHFT